MAAEHFQPSPPSVSLLQLPRTVMSFGQWLIGQKNWMVRTLGDLYYQIAKAQSAFLLELHFQSLTELPITLLKERFSLPYHESTYSRLLQNRCVKIISPGATRVLPIRFLLPKREEIAMYNWFPRFNRAMENELVSKTAVSDNDLATVIKSVSRRTVTKQRQLANIPTRLERQEEYESGRRSAYRLSTEIELFLEKDWLSNDAQPSNEPAGHFRITRPE
jgi:DNA-directed RNA polymerase specialized sigma54-like protein